MSKNEYVPFEQREPLTANFIMTEYWARQKTTLEIAEELNVPENWVYKEIKRLGLQKKQNGIKLKSGHKGEIMSKKEREKRQNQPHAKPIVQICPKTLKVIKEFSSQGAVNREGFNREKVRSAIKTGGLSKGYFWAFKGFEAATIEVVKRRGTIDRKLQVFNYKKPSKKTFEYHYITQNKTAKECALIFECHPGTIAALAKEYKLSKRRR